MEILAALCGGQRVRHCAWPIHHFAELRSTRLGELRLHRVMPDGDAMPLDVNLRALSARDGWLILDGRSDQ